MQIRPLVHTAAGLAAAIAMAFAFRWLDLPLAYILGSLVGAALYANAVGEMRATKLMRRTGQLAIGLAVAALLTPAVVAELVRMLPVMLAVAVASNAAAALLSVPVARIAGVDRVTALLACLPAGMAEMASLARDMGGKEHVVALIHTLRVVLVLALVPLWVAARPPDGPEAVAALAVPDAAWLATLAAGSAGLAWAAARLGVLNPWVVVPMAAGMAVAAFGGAVPALPPAFIVAAQIAIGASLGVRFRLADMAAFPRAAAAGVFSGILLIVFCFSLLSLLVAETTELARGADVLAVAPGGLGEMIATSKALGLAVAGVAGFQFVRSALTNMLVPQLIRLLAARSGRQA